MRVGFTQAGGSESPSGFQPNWGLRESEWVSTKLGVKRVVNLGFGQTGVPKVLMGFNKSWSVLAPGSTRFTEKFGTETKERKIGMEREFCFGWGGVGGGDMSNL